MNEKLEKKITDLNEEIDKARSQANFWLQKEQEITEARQQAALEFINESNILADCNWKVKVNPHYGSIMLETNEASLPKELLDPLSPGYHSRFVILDGIADLAFSDGEVYLKFNSSDNSFSKKKMIDYQKVFDYIKENGIKVDTTHIHQLIKKYQEMVENLKAYADAFEK